MTFNKFEQRAPAAQNVIDIFAGKWASDLSTLLHVNNTGTADLFLGDPRPRWAAEALGNGAGRLDGMRVLELGPLEGGHSYQLEQLGAAYVLAIDANVEAYLKCLLVKELLDLKRCHFLLGDAIEYMTKTQERFDVVFCSGILYHMRDPIQLIRACCGMADRCFVWTHYYNDERGNVEGWRTPRPVFQDGITATYYELAYADPVNDTFWGGNTNTRAWMRKDHIFDCFGRFGLNQIKIFQDDPMHQNGAAMSFAASKFPMA